MSRFVLSGLFAVFALVSLSIGSPAEAIQRELGSCPGNATSLRGTNQTYACQCSAQASAAGAVWGTDEYSDDSRICRAAVHAGMLGRRGGRVLFKMTPGLSEYPASWRNGVQSSRWGSWRGSFRFTGGRYSRDPSARAEQCPANATGLRGRREAYRCFCLAANTRTGNVWGDLTYTDDSRICRAALHAGVIGPDGGTVTIRPSQGLRTYYGTRRNGVVSREYGRWSGSFRFE